MNMTTILICSLSVLLLVFALRVWFLSRLIDDLELRVLRLEKRLGQS
jgi:hypothetical protein